MIDIRLIGPPDEVEPVIERMKDAVRVEVKPGKPSRFDASQIQYKGFVELRPQTEEPQP